MKGFQTDFRLFSYGMQCLKWWFKLSHQLDASLKALKTLFNIVEERLKKLLNFDVSAV